MAALLLKPSFVLSGFLSTVPLAQVQLEWSDSLRFVLDILS